MESHVADCHPNQRIRPCDCDIKGKLYAMMYRACYQQFKDGDWVCVGRQNKARPTSALPECLPVMQMRNGVIVDVVPGHVPSMAASKSLGITELLFPFFIHICLFVCLFVY